MNLRSFFIYRSPAKNAQPQSEGVFFGKEDGKFFSAQRRQNESAEPFFTPLQQSVSSGIVTVPGNTRFVQRKIQKGGSVKAEVETIPTSGVTTRAESLIQQEDKQDASEGRLLNISLGYPGDSSYKVPVQNYGDLATAYRAIESAMFFDRDEFMPDEENNPKWELWGQYYDNTIPYMTFWYEQKDASQEPVPGEISHFNDFLGDVRKMARECYRAYLKKDWEFKKKIGKERAKLEAARKKAQQSLRLQFLGGVEADETSAFLWSMVDHLGTFSGELIGAMKVPYTVGLAGKVIPGTITVANVVVNWSKNTPATTGTALEGMTHLNNIISLGGAANSFFVNPAYIVTAYIGPMLSAITILLGRLQMQLIRKNDEATEILNHPLYIGAEPGGKEMWNYMVDAMHASSQAEIDSPSGDVYNYFDEYRDRFDAFNKKKAEGERKTEPLTPNPETIPTEASWLIFSEVDPEKFPEWLFTNRKFVWTLLYGSRGYEKAEKIK